ncbi:hypothetical protein BLNAU_6420 [Blattamonas nauphoetae]|uniref:Amine oxidase domain-containing protein n=1 Tax=Blattamonas nauphoetae TaxID=2049346 RepID=A0ABQ9Y4K0_9EUKA|nr:hypothetical protein BLNAU_6420 [Blattamonas nauphoetae]
MFSFEKTSHFITQNPTLSFLQSCENGTPFFPTAWDDLQIRVVDQPEMTIEIPIIPTLKSKYPSKAAEIDIFSTMCSQTRSHIDEVINSCVTTSMDIIQILTEGPEIIRDKLPTIPIDAWLEPFHVCLRRIFGEEDSLSQEIVTFIEALSSLLLLRPSDSLPALSGLLTFAHFASLNKPEVNDVFSSRPLLQTLQSIILDPTKHSQIRTNCKVRRILTEKIGPFLSDCRASGVEYVLPDSSEPIVLRASVVVSDISTPHMINLIHPEPPPPPEITPSEDLSQSQTLPPDEEEIAHHPLTKQFLRHWGWKEGRPLPPLREITRPTPPSASVCSLFIVGKDRPEVFKLFSGHSSVLVLRSLDSEDWFTKDCMWVLLTCHELLAPHTSPGEWVFDPVTITAHFSTPSVNWEEYAPFGKDDERTEEYDSKKLEMMLYALDTIEGGIPNFREVLGHIETASPATIRAQTGNPDGACLGFRQSGTDAIGMLANLRMPLRDLYSVGGWSQFGGGLENISRSSLVAAVEIARRAGKGEFQRGTPI